jgi:hypothetical protein
VRDGPQLQLMVVVWQGNLEGSGAARRPRRWWRGDLGDSGGNLQGGGAMTWRQRHIVLEGGGAVTSELKVFDPQISCFHWAWMTRRHGAQWSRRLDRGRSVPVRLKSGPQDETA